MISASSLALGISLRMANDGDLAFLATVYQDARPDLDLIDREPDFLHLVREQQYQAHQQGSGDKYPNAVKFIIEKAQHGVGALVVDFGHNEVRVLFLACIKAARGFGYGKAVLEGVQHAAAQNNCPVTRVLPNGSPADRKLHLELGFQVVETHPAADLLMWYPGARSAPPA